MGANLVGQGACGGLKAWSAERGRCGLFAAFKAPLAWLADGRLPPLVALGLRHTERPSFAQSVSRAWVGKGAVTPAGALQNGAKACWPGCWRCRSAGVCRPACRRVFVQAVGFAQPCVQRTRLRRGRAVGAGRAK